MSQSGPRTAGLPREAVRRLDGKLEEAMSGAGVRGVDAGAGVERKPVFYSTGRARLEYRQSWAAKREIDRPAHDMVSGGFTLQDLPPGFDATAIVDAVESIGSAAVPEDAGAVAALAALYAVGNVLGGAALVAVHEDGLESWQPVDLNRIQRVVSLELLERDEITPWRPSVGGPIEFYIIGTARTKLTAAHVVHASRVILCKGARLTPSEEFTNQGWGASALELLHTERQSMHIAHQEMGTLILRATFDVAYLAELNEMLCPPDGDGSSARASVEERMAMVKRSQGQHRIAVMDAGRAGLDDDEPARPSDRIESVGRPVEGVAKLAVAVENGWAAGTGQTPSIALGRNVGGLNTGANAGDWQSWGSDIEGRRDTWLFPRLDLVVLWTCASKQGPTGGRIPETWTVSMGPLWVPPAKETAEVRKLQAEGDEVYARVAGLSSAEIREQRQVLGATGELRLEPLPEVLEVDPLLVGGADDASKQALNGAQIRALFELSANVSAGVIPVETALWLVALAIPGIDETAARAALIAAGNVEPVALAAAVEPAAGVDVAVADAVARAFVARRDAGRKWWRRDAKPTPAQALESWRQAWAG
jgi:phage-related protein (TIGR01555 family)